MSQHIRYTHEVGRKFHTDGRPRLFPGNTIICFVAPDEPLFSLAVALQHELAQQPYGYKYALLPPSSFHMTMMELLCFQVALPEKWTPALPLDASVEEADRFFIERVPQIPRPQDFTMNVNGFHSPNNLLVKLQPADAQVADALRAYRESVAETTGVRFLDHDSYKFHMSLAYRIIELDETEEAAFQDFCAGWGKRLVEQSPTLQLAGPELTFFDDMFRFVPVNQRSTLRSRQA